MLFLILLETGLRITEAGSIRLANIDFESKSLELPPVEGISKRKQLLRIPISDRLIWELEAFIAAEGIEDRLFPAFNPRTFRKSALAYFKKCLERAGIKANYNLHSFRHTFALHWLQGGGSMYLLAKYLGHSHASTSELYSHFSQEGLKQGLEARHQIELDKSDPFSAHQRLTAAARNRLESLGSSRLKIAGHNF